VQGLIAPGDGRADLVVPLAELSVDEPALRAEGGLDTQPSEADIAATQLGQTTAPVGVQREIDDVPLPGATVDGAATARADPTPAPVTAPASAPLPGPRPERPAARDQVALAERPR
jgi:hypothetical protein